MDLHNRIKEKAKELFRRYGIRCITMDEMAGQLGMSKKTIYQCFSDKETLVASIFEQEIEENKRRNISNKKNADNAVSELFMMLENTEETWKTTNPIAFYDLEKHHPHLFKKFYEYKNTFLLKIINDNLLRGISEGLYKEDIDIEIMSRYRVATLMISTNTDIFPQNKYSLVDIECKIWTHFISGIATIKGLKLIQQYAQKYERINHAEIKKG